VNAGSDFHRQTDAPSGLKITSFFYIIVSLQKSRLQTCLKAAALLFQDDR